MTSGAVVGEAPPSCLRHAWAAAAVCRRRGDREVRPRRYFRRRRRQKRRRRQQCDGGGATARCGPAAHACMQEDDAGGRSEVDSDTVPQACESLYDTLAGTCGDGEQQRSTGKAMAIRMMAGLLAVDGTRAINRVRL